MTALFHGLSAFPLTPADGNGKVDTEALGRVLDRLVAAEVASIGVLGSTGAYAYLDLAQRRRVAAAAAEAVAGRTPLIVGVGALRTSWARDLARDAERAGADALLLAPMSYTPLTPREAADHYRAVAEATGLPLCIYNNPVTTHFSFPPDLLARLAATPGVAAVKMPPRGDGDYAGELSRLRGGTPAGFAVGYSGDPHIAAALGAGADAFYSAVAGVLPRPLLRLARAAQAGRVAEAASLEAALEPLWALVRAHGGLRVSYAVAHRLGLPVGAPPEPLRGLDDAAEVDRALEPLHGL